MNRAVKKIGIMGGTFDPIHMGHLILGEKAYEQLGLDKVLFMPCGNPPHKLNRTGRATDAQRSEMHNRWMVPVARSPPPRTIIRASFFISFPPRGRVSATAPPWSRRRQQQPHPRFCRQPKAAGIAGRAQPVLTASEPPVQCNAP